MRLLHFSDIHIGMENHTVSWYNTNMTKMLSAKLRQKYSGMYVLTDKPGGKVVAASRNLGKAFGEAEEKGYKLPAVQYVPPYGVITIYEVKISLRD